MARPKNPEDTLQVTIRLAIKRIKELDEIAEAMYSNRTAIIKQCIKLGLNVLKKENPGIKEQIAMLRKRKQASKKILTGK